MSVRIQHSSVEGRDMVIEGESAIVVVANGEDIELRVLNGKSREWVLSLLRSAYVTVERALEDKPLLASNWSGFTGQS